MRTVYLIRHGATAGNLAKRYIGCTDEPLCDSGIAQAQKLAENAPKCDAVFSSPLSRALQTAAIAYPGITPVVIEDLRECDFGDFVGKTADEMAGDAAYRAWVDTNCQAPIPGGEDVAAFKARCVTAFKAAANALKDGQTAAFVSHGGSIMAILESLAATNHGFFEFYPRNCEFVTCEWANGQLTVLGDNVAPAYRHCERSEAIHQLSPAPREAASARLPAPGSSEAPPCRHCERSEAIHQLSPAPREAASARLPAPGSSEAPAYRHCERSEAIHQLSPAPREAVSARLPAPGDNV